MAPLASRPVTTLIGALVLSASLCALTACKSGDKEPSTDPLELIPASMHAVYGRTAVDAPGMTVTATGLEFGTLKFIIHEGKMEGDTVRVERATLMREALEPKTCTGTINRRGENLLLSLFDVDDPEAKCGAVLDTQWFHWVEVEGLPEVMHGRYGNLVLSSRHLRLDIDWMHSELEVGKIWQLPGTNDERAELLIDAAKIKATYAEGEQAEFICDGKLTLVEGKLEADFWVPSSHIPAEGSEEAKDEDVMGKVGVHRVQCDDWDGFAFKNVVRLDDLPTAAPIQAGEVSLAISAEQVVFDSPALRCEQELYSTSTVETRAGWGDAQFGGERMQLGRAVPTKVSDECKLKMRIWCEGSFGVQIGQIDAQEPPREEIAACLEQTEHDLCPSAITVREISSTRFKLNVEPKQFNAIACVDTTPEFALP